ncbi:MAG: 30S ribosomal protein S19e [Candidatus Thermoplasmatota archaeon]
MITVYDVPPTLLIQKVAEKLKEKKEISPPVWTSYVKTGVHKEKQPTQKDWWYARVAAVLRKVYIKGPIGTSRLRKKFGGAKDRGDKPNRSRKGSGSIIRKALQQLENAGFVTNLKGKGRVVSNNGRKFMDNVAKEVYLAIGSKDG